MRDGLRLQWGQLPKLGPDRDRETGRVPCVDAERRPSEGTTYRRIAPASAARGGRPPSSTRRPRRQHTRAYSDPRTRASPATSGGARAPRLFRECVIIGVHRPVWMKRLPPVYLDDAAEGFAGSADRNPRREPPLFASIVSRRSCHLMKCDFVRLSRRPARVVRRDEVSRPS